MTSARLALLIALASGLGPSAARADSALLPGLQIGGALSDPPLGRPRLAFRIGAGLDWLHEVGPVVQLRADTTERVDTTVAALAGYWGPGLRGGHGLPFGLSAGPTLGVNLAGDLRWGGRATLAYSLWYGRAVLEADAGLDRAVVPDGHRGAGGWGWTVGLSLRVVPLAPIVL